MVKYLYRKICLKFLLEIDNSWGKKNSPKTSISIRKEKSDKMLENELFNTQSLNLQLLVLLTLVLHVQGQCSTIREL